MRVDRWLWTARVYRTRPLAAAAVSGGHVRLGGQPVKPSREVAAGDTLEITQGEQRRVLVVRGEAPRRVSPPQVAALYEETADSLAARERARETARLQPARPAPGGRPTKRERRRYEAQRGDRRER